LFLGFYFYGDFPGTKPLTANQGKVNKGDKLTTIPVSLELRYWTRVKGSGTRRPRPYLLISALEGVMNASYSGLLGGIALSPSHKYFTVDTLMRIGVTNPESCKVPSHSS